MKSGFLRIIPIFIFVLIAQTTLIPLIELKGIIPDLILILLVYYSIKSGQLTGTLLGFTFGLFFDLFTGSALGGAMLSKTVAGFVAGYFSVESKRELYLTSFYFLLIVFLCALIDSVIYSLFTVVDLNTNIFSLIFQQGLLPALYTSVISTIVLLFKPLSK